MQAVEDLLAGHFGCHLAQWRNRDLVFGIEKRPGGTMAARRAISLSQPSPVSAET